MATGRIKWFNNTKGYGFICPSDGGQDVFVHYSAVEMEGFKSLQLDQQVEFQMQASERGLCAAQVRVVSDRASEDEDDCRDTAYEAAI